MDVQTGSLASITHEALLAGGNLAALVTDDNLEVLQFGSADLVAEGRYRVSNLVRGLGGTEHAASMMTSAGARFVLLDENPVDLNLSPQALIGGTTLRVEPHSGGVGTFSRTEQSANALPRSLQPLAPVHLRASFLSGGDLTFSWIRRSRGTSDLWELSSIPLGEETELYRVTASAGGTIVRQAEVAEPSWIYAATDITADGLTPGDELQFSVAQLGTGGRLGASRSLAIIL